MCIAWAGQMVWQVTTPEPPELRHLASSWIEKLSEAILDKGTVTLPKVIAGIQIPDTELARDAAAIMESVAPPTLFNHCLRSYVLGSVNAHALDLEIDEEMAFVSSILHDIGLTIAHSGDPRRTFEHNGAEFAWALVEKAGYRPDRADNVFKAILLHAGQAKGQPDDIEFVMIGAGQDVLDLYRDRFSDEQIRDVEKAIPRLAFKIGFLDILNDHLTRSNNPSWTKSFVRSPPPNFYENRWTE